MSHPKPNFEKMLALIDEVFDTRHDPDQLQVNQAVMKKLESIHPATLGEIADENGPCSWVLLIPTTKLVMDNFLSGKISEKDIVTYTNTGEHYEAVYLCSATTLPEYRGKGLTKKLCIQSLEAIAENHRIHTLYVWPFSKQGERLADSIADTMGMVLLKK